MKILYVSQYFPPEMGAPAARAAELAQHWRQAGNEVTILTGFPNHPTGVIPESYRGKFRRMFMREEFCGINVVRTWLLPLPNRRAYERMLNYSSFCVSSAVSGLALPRPDVVIATSPQLLVGLSGWWLAHCKGVPFVFEVRDLWPESLAAVGVTATNSLFNRSLRRLARFLYDHSQRIVVVTPAFKDYLVEHWHVARQKISVVENGVETALFSPHSVSSDIRSRFQLNGKFLVCYIGTVGMAHGLDTLLRSAQRLQTAAPQVAFLLIGEGAEKQRLKKEAILRGLGNIIFLDQQPREKIPGFICASDACLVLLKKNRLFQTVIPTKMLEFMSCGKPVILGVEGHARQMIERAKSGIAIEPENSADLTAAILRLAGDAPLCESLGRNGRRYVVQNCSRQKTACSYLNMLESMLTRTNATREVAA